jgi:ketosteroid isomerase-like protein
MSQENLEMVRRYEEAWNRDDFDAWIEIYDLGVEWAVLMEVYRGHAGARQTWESFKADMQLTIRYDDVRDLGESVLALREIETTGQTTGLNFTTEIAQLFTFRDGKVVNVRDFGSHAEALEAAGLREQAGRPPAARFFSRALPHRRSRSLPSHDRMPTPGPVRGSPRRGQP